MDQQTAWQRFVQTGTVEDYLEYTRYRSAESLMAAGPARTTEEGVGQGDADDRPRGHHPGANAG